MKPNINPADSPWRARRSQSPFSATSKLCFVLLATHLVLSQTAPAQTCASAPSGLISWWRAESDAQDSASTNNGILVNGTMFATGEAGQSFDLNGVDQYVEILNS